MKIIGAVPAALLVILLIAAVWGKIASQLKPGIPEVRVEFHEGAARDILYVMVPGILGWDKDRTHWHKFAAELRMRGDVAMIDYPAHGFSNADPSVVAQKISTLVQHQSEQRKYQHIVLVGNSVGALLVRKAFLYAEGATDDLKASGRAPWSAQVQRLVLLAGMNRGWDLSGEKPADMRWYAYYAYSAVSLAANLTHSGQLLLQMQAGAPFVANLRLEWMRWARDEDHRPLETVQLLGDIDEFVSSADNEDLRVSGAGNFTWIKVRGTGHADILRIDETEQGLGAYRLNKFLAAIDLPFVTLQSQSEELPYQTDSAVKHIVFVMHGIRDLGEWSSSFETSLQKRVAEVGCGKLAIASIRYGYFGMGQFLLRRDRQKYVRWFMDQYTETLARYPKATEIDFVGHSNGTYLLTSALDEYPSLRVRRVVLGGSVVARDYDWKRVFDRQQVAMVRNYVAEDDWVVALFPRFFEPLPMRWLGNDIGSAGFNGFDAGNEGPNRQQVDNVKFILGQHGAFLSYVKPIAEFLIPAAGETQLMPVKETDRVAEPPRTKPLLKFISDWMTWLLWLPLVFVILWLGSRVSGAAGHLSAAALFVYLLIVFEVLRWI